MVEVFFFILFYIGALLPQLVVSTLPCSTKRIDNSNSRLVSQVDKETGELLLLHSSQFQAALTYWNDSRCQYCTVRKQPSLLLTVNLLAIFPWQGVTIAT